MKILLLMSVLLFTTSQAIANESGKCNKGERLASKLQLDEQQTEQFSQIVGQQHEKRRDVMKTHREQMKVAMENLHNDTRQQLSSVLTEEQLAAYDELHNERMEKRQQRREQRKERFREFRQGNNSEPAI